MLGRVSEFPGEYASGSLCTHWNEEELFPVWTLSTDGSWIAGIAACIQRRGESEMLLVENDGRLVKDDGEISRACNGAPIVNDEGKLIALVSHLHPLVLSAEEPATGCIQSGLGCTLPHFALPVWVWSAIENSHTPSGETCPAESAVRRGDRRGACRGWESLVRTAVGIWRPVFYGYSCIFWRVVQGLAIRAGVANIKQN